jgi:hypothetical protein
MKATPALARALRRLLVDGRVPASAVGQRVATELRGLLDAGVLAAERRGGGERLILVDRAALEAAVARWFPAGLDAVIAADEPLASRADAVASRRDAKAAPRGATQPVLVRGFGDAVLRRGDDRLEVARLTTLAGYAALELAGGPPWRFDGRVAVVENLEPFRHVERVVPGVDLAVYAGGRLSGRLLAWLGGEGFANCSLIHWGDHDPTGVDDYLRLAAACPGPVELWMPEGLAGLFRRYGKPELVRDGASVLARLRRCDDPQVRAVVGLMDAYGAGVEQESLLVGLEGRHDGDSSR